MQLYVFTTIYVFTTSFHTLNAVESHNSCQSGLFLSHSKRMYLRQLSPVKSRIKLKQYQKHCSVYPIYQDYALHYKSVSFIRNMS